MEGSDTYQTRLDFIRRGEIYFRCTCPYHDDHLDICKHVWATFLAADREKLLPEWNNTESPALSAIEWPDPEEDDDEFISDFDEEEDEDDFDEDEDEDLDFDLRNPPEVKTQQQQSERMKDFWQQWQKGSKGGSPGAETGARPNKPPSWKLRFADLHNKSPHPDPPPEWPHGRQILYVLRLSKDYLGDRLAVEINSRERKKNGEWGKPRACGIPYKTLHSLPEPQDRQILQVLIGTPGQFEYEIAHRAYFPSGPALTESFRQFAVPVAVISVTTSKGLGSEPLAWDPREPWQFKVEVRGEKAVYALSGVLQRGEERAGLNEPTILFDNGLLILNGRIGRFDHGQSFDWVRLLRQQGRVEVPKRDRQALFEEILRLPQLPVLDLPEELRFEEIRATGRPVLKLVEEGHKALVFSQFTSMLSILKPRLREKKFTFAYLDGKTRDREAEVARFQNDPGCRLFLISLKAGGLGLNLTAAEYVFLLDPWWNPAVEMQAVDRSHRIGQTRTVFAYRLIASDTVEEKVLELQRTKRDLADAIINADYSLIRDLRPEDLALLLS